MEAHDPAPRPWTRKCGWSGGRDGGREGVGSSAPTSTTGPQPGGNYRDVEGTLAVITCLILAPSRCHLIGERRERESERGKERERVKEREKEE